MQVLVIPANAGIQAAADKQIFVIPANAGIQAAAEKLDTRFRGYDEQGGFRSEKDKIYRETV